VPFSPQCGGASFLERGGKEPSEAKHWEKGEKARSHEKLQGEGVLKYYLYFIFIRGGGAPLLLLKRCQRGGGKGKERQISDSMREKKDLTPYFKGGRNLIIVWGNGY